MYKTITNECTFLFIPVRSEVFAVSLPEVENGGIGWFLPPS